MDYKVQFPGPTGTNSVESALKLARKVTQREKVLSFTNGFHGMTLGSLAISGSSFKRDGAGIALTHNICMPYCGYFGDDVDTIAYIDRFLSDQGSGVDLPCAAVVETVQAEGGVNVAAYGWLRDLEALCRRYDMLLIVDDIQVGCGRTGPFFSFEPAGIEPDIVCLSKSISGYGLPLALTLLKPELDRWLPGEHNGTFRGHNLAFVTAAEALTYWETDALSSEVRAKGAHVRRFLERMARMYPEAGAEVRGRGLIQGIAYGRPDMAQRVCRVCFERGLVMETSGPDGCVAKVMPPLVIAEAELEAGLRIIEEATAEVVREEGLSAGGVPA
jgi:diaminobutyrate-2-oxoglutarate transaminase